MNALISISHSLYQTLRHLELRDAIPDIFRAARGIVRALLSRSQPARDLAALRQSHCESCVFYDSKWKTCGTPGEIQEAITTDDGTYFPPTKLGCWCYLPLANRDPKKDCWARFKGLDHVGWPDVLRPSQTR